MEKENIIEINGLSIEYQMKKYSIRAINDVSLNIKRGKVTAIVGESGGGKTTLVSAFLKCISEPGKVVSGTIDYYGEDINNGDFNIMDFSEKQLRYYRWKDVSIVFQGSQSALNPIMTIEDQLFETAYYHGFAKNKREFYPREIELLKYVKLDPARVLKCYPHELSGGMKQRVMIAFALILNPDVMILDEPTTALDVVTQNYVFDILEDINKKKQITMILLTHDIGIVAKFADYVSVIYAGQIMEFGDVYTIFEKPFHPYTAGLIKATPSLLNDVASVQSIPGEPPDLLKLPEGCPFSPRCPFAQERCRKEKPIPHDFGGHIVRCHFPLGGGKNAA
jgi:peptide/nickel transport system ATP-binding protein